MNNIKNIIEQNEVFTGGYFRVSKSVKLSARSVSAYKDDETITLLACNCVAVSFLPAFYNSAF